MAQEGLITNLRQHPPAKSILDFGGGMAAVLPVARMNENVGIVYWIVQQFVKANKIRSNCVEHHNPF